MKIDPDWLREMMERQGDISDPAPYRTRRDEEILRQRQAELTTPQGTNGTHVKEKSADSLHTGPETASPPAKTN
jgi:hypothetical protein